MTQTLNYGGTTRVAAPDAPSGPGTLRLNYGGTTRVAAIPLPGTFTLNYGGRTRVAAPAATTERSVEILKIGNQLVEVPLLVKIGGQLVDPLAGGSEPTPPGLTIAQENALPGTALPPITAAGNVSTLHGFAREFSIQAGQTQQFSCHGTTASAIDIYRLGWYGGAGARLVTTVANTGASQPNPTTIAGSNGATTCTGWSTTASWAVPADATSGFYVGVLRNSGSTARFYIPFLVRRDDRTADVMYKASDSTWALAYNHYGTPGDPLNGKSVYGSYSGGVTGWDIANRGHAATYHRPIVTRNAHPVTYWLNAEAPMIRWLERNGYDLSYTACKDWGEWAGAPTPAACRCYVSCGHDEYWSTGMDSRWKALRDAGKHLLFVSGNERWWRTRFSADGHTMWCFKDTMAGPGAHVAGTALDPVTWTGTWRDTRAANNATRDPEWNLTGCRMDMNGIRNETLSMSSASPLLAHAFWRGTTAPTSGLSVPGIIGFEADSVNPQQPVGSYARLAQVQVNISGAKADVNGENYTDNGTLDWGIISQRYASGAVVVGFGTCQWPWGLDDGHDNGSSVANATMRQATMNLLRDLGAVPASPMSGLSVPSPVSLNVYGAIPA